MNNRMMRRIVAPFRRIADKLRNGARIVLLPLYYAVPACMGVTATLLLYYIWNHLIH